MVSAAPRARFRLRCRPFFIALSPRAADRRGQETERSALSSLLSSIDRNLLQKHCKTIPPCPSSSPHTQPDPLTQFQPQSNHKLLQQLSSLLADLAAQPSAQILDALRGLERKTTTVFTLLKASVYSIVLQQEIYGGEREGEGSWS